MACRREFLKTLGAAALLTGASGKKVSLAFIGAGRTEIAAAAGFAVVAACAVEDFRKVLSDPSVDAVAIAAPLHCRARIAIEACKAGKDVWAPLPVCANVDEGVQMTAAARKYERIVQGGAARRSSGVWRKARDIVRNGELGEVAYCRSMADWGVHAIDLVQFVFDEATPLSIAAQGGKTRLAICRYPGFVAAHEPHPAGAIAFHGSRATLVADGRECRLFPSDLATPERAAEMNLAHWRNFIDCIRSREKPAADIETSVRSTVTFLLADAAMRANITLDWKQEVS